MSGFLPVGTCAPDDYDWPTSGPAAQALRKIRYSEYGLPVHKTCYICGALGECWSVGHVWMCGDHRDAHKQKIAMTYAA